MMGEEVALSFDTVRHTRWSLIGIDNSMLGRREFCACYRRPPHSTILIIIIAVTLFTVPKMCKK